MPRPLRPSLPRWAHKAYLVLLVGTWLTMILSILIWPQKSQETLGLLILTALFIHLLRNFIFLMADRCWIWKLSRSRRPLHSHPLVTVLIPCFNEESVINATLRSLEELDESALEILVIDDGSSDQTAARAEAFAKNSKLNIQVIRKANSGKASSLNLGISMAKGEFILCVDADSQIEPSGLHKALVHFEENPNLGAIAGNVIVGNSDRKLTALQNLEYRISNLQKSFFSLFGLLSIIPGPIGLFRTTALKSVGGYCEDKQLFAEDADLTLRLMHQGWNAFYEPALRSQTEAPEDNLAFLRQRYRWFRGTSQAISRNVMLLLQSPQLKLKLFGVYLLFEQYLLLLLESSVLMAFVLSMIISAEVEIYTASLLLILALDLTVIWACQEKPRASIPQMLRQALLLRFNYSVVLTTWKSLSQLEESRQITMSWDKIQRHGRIQISTKSGDRHA